MNPIRLRVLPALPGVTGDQGPVGPLGPQGPQGPAGPLGPAGPAVSDGNKGDVTVSSAGAAWDITSRKVIRNKLWEPLDIAVLPNLTEFGPDRTGVSSATPAFQSALNLPASGKVITVQVPEGTYNLATSPTIGAGVVNWDFLPGAVLTGAGVLPFYQKSMLAEPGVKGFGYRHQIQHGSFPNPDTTSGPEATDYVGRVDQTVRADAPTSLLHVRLTTLIRKDGGTGWIQANKTYVEDRRLSAGGETVGNSVTMWGFGAGSVWGNYSESAIAGFTTARGKAIGYEINVSNFTDIDYTYNESAPTVGLSTKGMWILGRGKKNSFAIGISSDAAASAWGAGLYIAFATVDKYAIDIQAQAETLIRLKYGAKTGGVFGGVGLECGLMTDAGYGTADGQGAILLRNHDMKMGATGNIAMRYNAGTNAIEFYRSGVLKQSLSMV